MINEDKFMKSMASDIAESVIVTDKFDFIRYAMQTALTTYGNDNEEAVNIFLAADK